jgi:hypothetical protein
MQYQTSAGPLFLRKVLSLILEDDDSNEILVGEQLLLDLGFDPQQLLADACVESNDRDCSHVSFEPEIVMPTRLHALGVVHPTTRKVSILAVHK